MQKTYNITVDLKQKSYYNVPEMRYNDENTLNLEVLDEGIAFSLASVTTISLAIKRPDSQVILLNGTNNGSAATFTLSGNELSVAGRCVATAQFYDAAGRVSTVDFTIVSITDPTANGYAPSSVEQTLIEIVLNDGPLRIQQAIDAAEYATAQGDYVESKKESIDYFVGQQTNLQAQINTLVVEGDSSPEAAQARVSTNALAIPTTYATLKARLDAEHNEVTTQLEETTTDLNQRGYNIQNSAIEVINGDWTGAIQNALNTHKHIYIAGNYNVHGTIELGHYNTIEFGNGAILNKPQEATNNDPVIWVNGNQSSIIGAGMRNSSIQSEKPSPLGVVCVGYKGVSDINPRSCVYDTIMNISIIGRTDGGETVGEPSYALFLCNNELSGLPSYFHTINNVFLTQANVGLMLEGYANANIINNIQLYRVGTNKQLDGAGIKLKETNGKYPVDNVISNVFHHASPNADTLFLDGRAGFNTIQNIVSEQGGASARWLRNNNDGAIDNIISGIDNVLGGYSVTENFYRSNTVTRRRTLSAGTISAESLNATTTKSGTLTVGTAIDKRDSFVLSALTENTKYQVLKINSPINTGDFIVELEATFRSTSVIPALWKTGKAIFNVSVGTGGVVSVNNVFNYSTRSVFVQPVVSGREVTFGVLVGDNGTATSTTACSVSYRILSDIERTITKVTTPTSMVGTAIPSARIGHFVSVPVSATAIGNIGDLASDTNYLYVCHAVNTWKRVAVSTW